ncbi:MAG: hypothetical protein HQM16_15610 [Deltaproteobacteria bacterium]|nr:hypothetical protein [Deltaproteobacteria bacterium]
MQRTQLIALTALICLASFFLFWQLSHDPYLRGADAYYYALQADHWAKTGRVKIPDSSPLHVIEGMCIKSGLTAETAHRVVCSAALLCTTLSLLFFGLKNKRPLEGLVLSGWCLLSPSLLFTAIEFPKMFVLLTLIPVWFYFALQKSQQWYLVFPFIVLGFFMHRAAWPLGILFGSVAVVMHLRQKIRWPLFFAIAVLSAVLLSLYFYLVKDRLTLLDLMRLLSESYQPGLITLFKQPALPVIIKLEIVAALVMVVCRSVITATRGQNKSQLLLLLALALPAIVPLGEAEVFGIGERYAILLPFVCMTALSFMQHQATRVAHSASRVPHSAAAVLVLGITGLFPFRLDYSHPASLDPDFKAYETITREIQGQAIPMLIAHRGLNFYYKSRTKKESFAYEPEGHWDKKRIWRVIYKIRPEELNSHLADQCLWDTGLVRLLPAPDYAIIREDCWADFRLKIDRENNPDLYLRVFKTYLNPSQKRPAFLYPRHQGDEQGEFSSRL